MANKWKYSTMTENERMGKIRGGDKDVFDAEISKTLDAIDHRNELNMDISEQKNYLDKVGYNYTLSSAEKMGIPATDVDRTGYAETYLSIPRPTKKANTITRATRFATLLHEANEIYKDFLEKAAKAKSERKNVEEYLTNKGIDKNSEDGKRHLDEFDRKLTDTVAKYKNDYISKVKGLSSKYA